MPLPSSLAIRPFVSSIFILAFLLILPSISHALPWQMRQRRQQFQQQPIQPQQQFFPQPIRPQQQQPQQQQPQSVTAYNEQFARVMLALAAGAYAPSPNPCIARWMPDAQIWRLYTAVNQTCDALDNTCSTYTIVAEERREMVVVFRGTKTKEQLFLEGWQSLQPGKDFYGIGKVNKYFFRALNTLWPSVQSALADPRHADFQVTFTGHSLGGALASLASIRAVLDGYRRSDQIKLYTFGQPRVGNAQFAFKHDELVPHSFRVVFRMDIVPHLPPCAKNEHWPGVEPEDDSKPCDPAAPGIAYHHGTEIWYPNGMRPGDRYYECVGAPRDEDFHCSDSLSFEVSKYETYIWDHRHYFDHKVPAFGKLGCDPNNKAAEEKLPNGTSGGGGESGAGLFAKLANKVRTLGRVIGAMFR